MTTETVLTDKQKAIIASVDLFWRQHGYAPSMREIQDATGIASVNTVYRNMGHLKRIGRLAFEPETSRSVRLVLRRGDVCPHCGCEGGHG